MTAIAIQNGAGFSIQGAFLALDSSGQTLYQSPTQTLPAGTTPYDWVYYVDPGLEGAARYAIILDSTQGTRQWDAWVLPAIGSLTGLLGDVVGAVSIGVGSGAYGPTYGDPLPDGHPVVSSVWSPSPPNGQQAQYVRGGMYTLLGSDDYPVTAGLLGICVTTATYPTTLRPPCCYGNDSDPEVLGPASRLPDAQLAVQTVRATGALSLLTVQQTTVTSAPESGEGEGEGGGLTAAQRGAALSAQKKESDTSAWWWVAALVVVVVLLSLLAGYVYLRRRRHNRE